MCDLFAKNLKLAIVDKNNNISSVKLSNLQEKHNKLYLELVGRTRLYPENTKLLERVFAVLNNYKQRPKCPCGKEVNFIRQQKRYAMFCSIACKYYRNHINNKVKESCMKKYGQPSSFHVKEVQDKVKTTLQASYGGNAMYDLKVKKKLKDTIKQKYGVDNISKNPKIKEQKKQTCLKKYGVDNPSKCKGWKGKVIETNLYNFEKPWYSMTAKYKKEVQITNFEKYGVKYINQEHIPINIRELMYDEVKFKKWLIEKHYIEKLTGDEIAELLEVTSRSVHNYFNKFEIKAKRFLRSALEKDIYRFIDELQLNLNIEVNNRTILNGLEVDLFLDKINLGIEVDGLYWHSFNTTESTKERHSHQIKTTQAANTGVELLHIFENEWSSNIKKEIWKSMLACKLGKFNGIYARKCQVREVMLQESKSFLETNHLQGFIPAKFTFGLYFDNELVSLMSFGTPRYSKKYEYELLRYTTKLNTRVVGGASKLFKYFIKNINPNTIISYCDLRYGTGKVYEKLGFNLLYITKPNYYYFRSKDKILFSRLKFQKHKLFKLLPNFDSKLTEAENMFANDYRRIWDCGNKVYLYSKF